MAFGNICSPSVQGAGTKCGTNALCNDAGACLGCIQPSDCSFYGYMTHDLPCDVRTCVSGACGMAFVEAGTSCSDAGEVCNGYGTCGPIPVGGVTTPPGTGH